MDYDRTMLNDAIRNRLFAQALRQRVRPGDVILDAGAGTGVLSIMAVKAGAGRVYAIEKRSVIHTAKNMAKANGCEDKIQFIKCDLMDLELPEKVDGAVSEMLGNAGIAENLVPVMSRLAERHCKPGAWLIPMNTTVMAAPMEDARLYEHTFMHACGLDMNIDPIRDEIAQHYLVQNLSQARLLCEPRIVARFKWGDEPLHEYSDANFTFENSGALHGFALWFTAELAPGLTLDTAPERPLTHWAQVYLPVRQPLKTESGQLLTLSFKGLPAKGGEMFYWRYVLSDDSGEIARAAHSNVLTGNALKVFPESNGREGDAPST